MRRFLSSRFTALASRLAPFHHPRHGVRIPSAALLLGFAAATAAAQGVQTFPGATAVGNTATLTVTVTVATAGIAATPKALTGGVASLDFSAASGGTCQAGTAYLPGQQCTVVAQFSPKYPGVRNGAVLLQDSNGNSMATALLAGNASGALPVLIPGRIDTAAGSGPWTYAADNVTATSATIFTPQGIVLDPAGNLLLSDTGNNRIRLVDAHTGLITTIAGNGAQGYSGDGGPATSASIAGPSGLLLDGAGNLYFADTQNDIIRRVDANTKTITTVAGTPQTAGYRGDGTAATSAQLNLPLGLALDNSGNLLIADTGNHVLRRVNLATGIITTIAGDGTPGFSGNNLLATVSRLNSPSGVLALADGSILIADTANHRIRRITTSGILTTTVGTGVQGDGTTGGIGDGGPAIAANLNSPIGLATDPVGNLYIADSGNNRVRMVDALTGNITSLVGTDGESFLGDGGPANLASLYGPFGVFFTQAGDLYLSDMFHMRVRRVSGSTVKLHYDTIRNGKVSPPQSQQLANYGNAPLQLAAPVLTYAALDSATTTCGTAPLAPSATCKLGVEFAPTVTGTDVLGSVELPSNAVTTTPIINLDGEVLDVNPTSAVVLSSVNPSVLGAAVTFTATISSDDQNRSGNVTFTSDGATLCTGPLGTNGTATCSTSTLALGTHAIVATYAGDAQNAAATSPTLNQVVKQQASFALTSSANPAVVTNSVTFTVVVSAGTGTPTGSVIFLDGNTSLGTVNLASGQASLTTSTLAFGTHSITVQYAGDTQNAPSTSAAWSQVINQGTTTTTLATSSATVPVGAAVTLTANVTSSNGPAPTGTVTFAEGPTNYGTAPLQQNGTATFTFSSLPPGTHYLSALYDGDPNSNTSFSAPLTEVVQQIATTTTLNTDANPLSAGATLHLTAQVAVGSGATASGTITGQVTFMDGATTLGTIQLSNALTAGMDVHALSVGTHALTAVYQGNTNYASSTGNFTEVVTQTSTTATLTSLSTPTLAGRAAIFNVTVASNTGTPTGTVNLMDGSTVVGAAPVTRGVATFTVNTLTPGAHTLTAAYLGDTNYLATTSAPILQTVNLAVATVTLSGPTQPVNVTATATFTGTLGSPGVTPSGTLTLQEGTTVLAIQAVSSNYSFSINSLPAGAHTVIVAYSGDSNNAAAQSAPVTLTVQLAPTATTLTGSGTPALLGSPVTLNATTTSATANLTGSVTFFDGATALGTANLINGAASLTTTALAFGQHTLTATYTADVNHAASTSAALQQNIVQQAQLQLTSALNPANSGQTIVFSASLPAIAGTTPTGTVVFSSDGATLATAPIDSTGLARVQTAVLSVATHLITATYAGDTSFAGTAATLSQVVRNAATTTVLTTSADTVTFSTPLTLTATVGSNGGRATGNVSFLENGISIGSAAVNQQGIATLSLTTLAPGRHTLTAKYMGDGMAAASVSSSVTVLVRQRTTLALGSSANPSLALNGITLTATLANGGAAPATGSIVFTDGTTTLATVPLDTDGRATLDLPPMSVGTHVLVAAYAGDDGDFPATTSPLQQVVQQRTTVTTLTTTATNAADAQQVTLIAIVQTPNLAAGTPPTGTVTFTNGGTTLGTVALDGAGVATLTIRLATSTTDTIIATYSGDVPYRSSTSAKATVTSGPASQFILTLSNPTVQLQSGNRMTMTVTVASVKGFSDMLNFGCLGLPFAATCTFSKDNMQLSADGSGTLQLTVDTGSPLGAGTNQQHAQNNLPTSLGKGLTLCLLPAALLLLRRNRRLLPTLLAIAFACAATFGITGCAGLTTNSTPAGTYSFQVTALGQGTGATQAQTITMTVAK